MQDGNPISPRASNVTDWIRLALQFDGFCGLLGKGKELSEAIFLAVED